MATGEVHFSVYNKWMIPVLIVGLALGFASIPVGVGIIIGYFVIGRYITPDQDQVGITSEEARLMKELKFVGVLIVCYFLPYAYFMRFVGIIRKGHRNFFSHTPAIGTLIRLIYLLLPLFGVWWYFAWPVDEMSILVLLGAFMGLTFADSLHFLYDLGEGKSHQKRKNVTKSKNNKTNFKKPLDNNKQKPYNGGMNEVRNNNRFRPNPNQFNIPENRGDFRNGNENFSINSRRYENPTYHPEIPGETMGHRREGFDRGRFGDEFRGRINRDGRNRP